MLNLVILYRKYILIGVLIICTGLFLYRSCKKQILTKVSLEAAEDLQGNINKTERLKNEIENKKRKIRKRLLDAKEKSLTEPQANDELKSCLLSTNSLLVSCP